MTTTNKEVTLAEVLKMVLKTLSRLDDIEAQVKELDEKVDNFDESKVDDLEGRIDDLEGKDFDELEGRIDELEEKDGSDFEDRIKKLEEQIENIKDC